MRLPGAVDSRLIGLGREIPEKAKLKARNAFYMFYIVAQEK